MLRILHILTRPPASARAPSAARPGDVSEAEVRLRDRHGNWRWVAARRQVTEDGAHMGNMRDIHAERAYREESEEARRTRKALGAAAGIGVWEFNPITGRIWWSDEIIGAGGPRPRRRLDRRAASTAWCIRATAPNCSRR